MKSVVTESKIAWLTSVNSEVLESCTSQDITQYRVPMDRGIGDGWIEIQNLSLGMTISRGVHNFSLEVSGQMVPLADITGEVAEPTLLIQTAKHGRVLLKERCAGVEMLFDSSMTAYQHIDRIDYLPVLDTSENLEVAVLHIGDSVLVQLLGETLANDLLTGLQINNIPSARTKRIPKHISRLLHSAHSTKFKKEIRKLFAQAKIFEYLCALADFLKHEKKVTEKKIDKKWVHNVAEELVALEGKIPSLADLAMSYGTSLKVLNDGFRNTFGQPVYQYITEQRLNDAHSALQETQISMKVLADNLGYSHVNHFITAFKKRYGYTPGSLRR
jgi:AraC-like DNA-binding protein